MTAPRPGPALVVGLTGGIGAGKSVVAGIFSTLGVPVIDADGAAREVVEPGEPGHGAIVEAFGPGVLDADGRIDRAALRRLVFEDAQARRRLEAIVHPRVRRRIRRALAALDVPYAVVEIQLLVESGQRDLVDRVLVVEAAADTRIARAMARDGVERDDVERIIAAQATTEQRRAAADDLLANEDTHAALEHAVAALHERYLTLAASREYAPSDLPGDARG